LINEEQNKSFTKNKERKNKMSFILVNHKVKDFNTWKPFFEGDESEQLKSGIVVNKLFSSVEDPNDVHILFEFSDSVNVQKFFMDPRLKTLMQKAGVISEPVVRILELA